MKAKELLSNNGELSHKTRTIKDLVRFIETRENEDTSNYSLLLGAGASRSSGISTASELIEKWKIELYERFESKPFKNSEKSIDEYFEKEHASWFNTLNPYSSLFEKKFDLPAQRRRFVEKEVSGKLPSIGYAFLISLVEKNFFNTIFTTNFDDLLNEAFYQLSTTRPIICAHDSSVHSISITSKRPKILKLHGDYLFEDIKSTLRETESLEQNIKDKLIEFCKEFGLIVIGYSGSDRSVMDVVDYLVKRDNYLKNGLYWCFREEDEINQNVKNLLWKDRVYPVLIDGFDELFAEIHYSLTKTFGQLFKINKETTQDKIATNIIENFQNSQNEIIRKEIEEMSKSRDIVDISNFINIGEYNNKKEKVSLKNLRNLLEVSELSIRSPEEAYNKCESYIEGLSNIHDKEKFLKKLIELSMQLNRRNDAISWANKLIDLDKYDASNQLIKIDCIEDVSQQEKEISELEKELSNHHIIYNKHIRILFKILEDEENDQIKIKNIIEKIEKCIEKSLKLNPSLSNHVFLHKHHLLSYKIENIHMIYNKDKVDNEREELEKKISELLEDVEKINKHHSAYTFLQKEEADRINSAEKYKVAIQKCYSVRDSQQQLVAKETNGIIDKMLIKYLDSKDSDGYSDIHDDFYSQISLDDNHIYSCRCLLSKALFLFFVKNDKETSVKYIKKALQDDDIDDELDYLISVSSIVDSELLNDVEKYIDEIKPVITDRYYWNLMCDLYSEYHDYKRYLEAIEQLYKISNDLNKYLSNKSFVLLKQEKYSDLIKLYDENKTKLKGDKFDIFKINVFIAKKKLSYTGIDLEIRDLLSKTKNELTNIVLTILLGENTNQAYSRLNKSIKTNPIKYYTVKDWVVIEQNKLDYKVM